MPIYEYQCETCSNCFEKLVFNSDEGDVVCPSCGSQKTKKLLSASSSMTGSDGGGGCAPNASSGFS